MHRYIENGCKIKNHSRFLQSIYMDDVSDSVYRKNLSEYESYLKESRKYLGSAYAYFTQLHDSPVSGIEYGNDISIRLDDMKTLEFARLVCDRYTPDRKPFAFDFPLTIHYRDVSFFAFYNITRTGRMKKYKRGLQKPHEYLYEEIFQIDENKIHTGIVIWYKDRPGFNYSPLLYIKAKRVECSEEQDQAWNKYFGNKYDRYYQKFKAFRAEHKFTCEGFKPDEFFD